MSELRKDPLTDRWTIFAENRAGRPIALSTPDSTLPVACPFCPGNERETPPAVATYPPSAEEEDGAWQVRVVPNKYPAIAPGSRQYDVAERTFESGSAVGVHEVIIESPRHVASFTNITPLQAELTFRAYQDRLNAIADDPGIAFALPFKNARAGGGASLEHSHSQLIALPFVPPRVQYELTKSIEHQRLHGGSLLGAMLADELDARVRVIEATNQFVVLCPYASRFPYEMWVVPRIASCRFEQLSLAELTELSQLVRQSLRALELQLENPAYNYWVRTAPLRGLSQPFHWRVEIAPRFARLAGFELAAECFINQVYPERAARNLRSGWKR